ncbi:MAG: ribosomal L7Ae/L30e/S12e/Gadd45 family protein [Eubacteriales bacterium]
MKDHRKRVVGKNQSVKAIRSGQAAIVYLAYDADSALISGITQLCEQHGVCCERTHSIQQLGAECGIEVGCAVCALLREQA